MTGLPPTWSLETIGMIARGGVFVDGDWVESKDQDPSGSVRLTQLADVGVGRFRDRSDRWMREDQAARLNCSFLEPGDVLVARMPDPIGRACLVPGKIGRAVTAVDVAIIRPRREDIDSRYLMWAINSPTVHERIAALQSGTTRKRISRKNLATVAVPVPPISEQRQIVEILEEHLSRLDAAERYLATAITRSDRLTEQILARQFASLEGHATTLGSIASWGSGGTPSARTRAYYEGGTIPWVNSGDLADGEIAGATRKITQQGFDSSSAKWVPTGSVLVAMYGATIGRTGLTTLPVTTNQAIAFASPHGDLSAAWLQWFLRSQVGQLRAAGKGGAQPNISQTVLKAWPVVVPSPAVQMETVALCNAIEADAASLRASLTVQQRKSASLRRSLLAAAFSGHLMGCASDIDRVEELAGVGS